MTVGLFNTIKHIESGEYLPPKMLDDSTSTIRHPHMPSGMSYLGLKVYLKAASRPVHAFITRLSR